MKWGVKSAVTVFALSVRRPFFLTFAVLTSLSLSDARPTTRLEKMFAVASQIVGSLLCAPRHANNA